MNDTTKDTPEEDRSRTPVVRKPDAGKMELVQSKPLIQNLRQFHAFELRERAKKNV